MTRKNEHIAGCGKWILALVSIFGLNMALAVSPSFEAEFSELSSSEPVNGRIHINIDVNILSDPRLVRVVAERVILEDDGANIVLNGQEADFDSQNLNPPWEQALSLTLDNLPSGEYPLRLVFEDSLNNVFLILDSVMVSVPEERRAELPLAVSTWPPDPTVLDDVWLIAEPISFCSEVEGGVVVSDAIIDDEPVSFEELAIFEVADDCPASGEQPQLKTLAFSGLGAGGRTNLIYIGEDTVQAESISIVIEERLSNRMAGSWYNPDQSGHGITLEILKDDVVLLYWFTFDDQGNPAWIIAQGESEGTSAILTATLVSGGRFPPDFDPADIDKQDWGEISLSFSDCHGGHMAWQSDLPGFSDGDMGLVRLSAPAGRPCQGPPPPAALVPAWYQGMGTYFAIQDSEGGD